MKVPIFHSSYAMYSSPTFANEMNGKYKHLFFDLDHTLWDFERNSEATLHILYTQYDLPSKGIGAFEEFHKIYSAHNNRMWERFRKGFMKREELRWKRMWLTLLDFKVADTALAHEMSAKYLELLPAQTMLMPFSKELLDSCKGRYELHLITNGFETTQWQKLRNSGIDSYFTHVVTSEKSNSLKPHKDIFDYALQVSGAAPESSLMLGDALDVDILGAQNAGWDQVYYNPLRIPHKGTPTYEVTCWSELLGKL